MCPLADGAHPKIDVLARQREATSTGSGRAQELVAVPAGRVIRPSAPGLPPIDRYGGVRKHTMPECTVPRVRGAEPKTDGKEPTMKTMTMLAPVLALGLGAALLATAAEARGGGGGFHVGTGSHNVSGYVRRDGTYVAPHQATNADSSRANNWTTRGNTNPYTGQAGTRDPDRY
jgi:hypothetical protein